MSWLIGWGVLSVGVVAYCGHISPDWRASADEAERIFNQAGVECLFTMD